MEKNLIITLPRNSDILRSQLERKVKEYQSRISKYPDNSRIVLDSQYKSILIGELIENGKVKIDELYQKINKEESPINEPYFYSACAVIYDYCTNKGNKVKGGTGLALKIHPV